MSGNPVLRWFTICAIAAIPFANAADPPPATRSTAPATVGSPAEISREQQIQRQLEQRQANPRLPIGSGMPANYDIIAEAATADLQTLYVVSNGAVDQNGNPGRYEP